MNSVFSIFHPRSYGYALVPKIVAPHFKDQAGASGKNVWNSGTFVLVASSLDLFHLSKILSDTVAGMQILRTKQGKVQQPCIYKSCCMFRMSCKMSSSSSLAYDSLSLYDWNSGDNAAGLANMIVIQLGRGLGAQLGAVMNTTAFAASQVGQVQWKMSGHVMHHIRQNSLGLKSTIDWLNISAYHVYSFLFVLCPISQVKLTVLWCRSFARLNPHMTRLMGNLWVVAARWALTLCWQSLF